MAEALKDIFSYGVFPGIVGKDHIEERELDKLKSLILLMQYSAEIRYGLRKKFIDTGLSQNKYYILMLLNEKGEELLTPSQIAEFLSVSRGTISDIIDGMEKDGFIERVMCKNDRRKIEVNITEKGTAAIVDIVPKYYAMTSELMACLTCEDVENLVGITKKLSDYMEKNKQNNHKK